MMCRFSFVANSSSSSFLVYGWCIEDKSELYKFMAAEVEEYCKETGTDKDDLGNSDFVEILDKFLSKKRGKSKIGYVSGQENVYICRSWDEVGDDETGGQFKKSIEKIAEELFPGIKKEFATHEEAWRDG